MKIPLADAIAKLPLPATERWPQGVWDLEALRHGTMSAMVFTPRGKDHQTFHDQDELYVVLKGSGVLVIDGVEESFAKGDALFVPAMKRHCFVRFSDDLITWAIFWGPKGGEKDASIFKA